MKNSILLLWAIAGCIVLSGGCNKDQPVNPTSKDPLVTQVGTPTDLAVSASIGASGGTMTSADGKLQLTVPANAVSATTIFSIQPVTNQCPGGIFLAYRLLPEGITFAQPVSLNFSYTDTLLSNENLLAIAYQDTDNTWFAPKVISLNAAGNSISVQTKHFSDWAMFQKIAIKPSNETVKINESLDLEVTLVGEAKNTIDNEGFEFANLNIGNTYASTWQVNGTSGNAASGYIVKQGEDKATYSAPSTVPSQNPVAVSATLNNVSFTLNGESFNNPQMIAHIRVISNEALFYVDFTSSRPYQPVGNSWFTETDRGSMSVLVQDDSVRVYALQNMSAEVSPAALSDAGSECTYTVISPGDGPWNFSPNVNFAGIYSSFNHSVYVGINSPTYSNGYTPSFQKSCTGGPPENIGGDLLPTGPFEFTFDANKAYQEFVQIIPGGGAFPDGFLKTAVTKIH